MLVIIGVGGVGGVGVLVVLFGDDGGNIVYYLLFFVCGCLFGSHFIFSLINF